VRDDTNQSSAPSREPQYFTNARSIPLDRTYSLKDNILSIIRVLYGDDEIRVELSNVNPYGQHSGHVGHGVGVLVKHWIVVIHGVYSHIKLN
jgi:hypothetical protein